MLESYERSENAFLTLTYSDEAVPRMKNGEFTLSPVHLRNWLKRFRKAVAPLRLRFFAVGEYGEEGQRGLWNPHYHVAMFGYSNCRYGKSRYSRRRTTCCDVCDLVAETWGHGNTFVAELNQQTAQYIAGYVTKKMTARDDWRLEGRFPEFARMSLRPGIGAGMMDDVASTVMEHDLVEVDVPTGLRHGRKIWPLGRYLRRRLRERVGMEPAAPANEELRAEVQALRAAAWESSQSVSDVAKEVMRPQAIQLEERERFHRKRKIL